MKSIHACGLSCARSGVIKLHAEYYLLRETTLMLLNTTQGVIPTIETESAEMRQDRLARHGTRLFSKMLKSV